MLYLAQMSLDVKSSNERNVKGEELVLLLRDNHVSWSVLNESCPVMAEQECSQCTPLNPPYKSWLHSTLSALHTKLPLFTLVLKSNAPSLPFSLPLCCPASLFSLPVYLFWPFHQLSPYLNVLHSLTCFFNQS